MAGKPSERSTEMAQLPNRWRWSLSLLRGTMTAKMKTINSTQAVLPNACTRRKKKRSCEAKQGIFLYWTQHQVNTMIALCRLSLLKVFIKIGCAYVRL